MKCPRVRFTVRWILLAVLIVGIGFWGFGLLKQVVICDRRSRQYAELERISRMQADGDRKIAAGFRESLAHTKEMVENFIALGRKDVDPQKTIEQMTAHVPSTGQLAAKYEASAASLARKADFYGSMKEKYRRSSRPPFRPVGPIPLEPE
jgi:hypothetical protein